MYNSYMRRIQQDYILKDLAKKWFFWLVQGRLVKLGWFKEIAKSFQHSVYLNYDRGEDRTIIQSEAWLESTDLLVIDELHKMPNWKQYIKVFLDTKPQHMAIFVTGSVSLDTFKSALVNPWLGGTLSIIYCHCSRLNCVTPPPIKTQPFVTTRWFPSHFSRYRPRGDRYAYTCQWFNS